jgi:predicted MFS family arabinose efflux permease
VLAALAAISIWLMLREPRKPQSAERGSWKDSWRLAADARLAAFLIYGLGLSTVTGTLQQTYTLYVMDKLGVRGEQAAGLAAWGFFVGAVAAVGTQLLLIPVLKWKARTFMTVGAALILGGAVAQMLASGFVGLVVSQLVQGVGFGLARSGFAGGSSMAVRPDEQGAAAGLVVAANGAGYVISPVSGGVAYDYANENAPLMICMAVLAAMAVFAWRSRRLRNAESTSM